jgi:hypothetical protein
MLRSLQSLKHTEELYTINGKETENSDYGIQTVYNCKQLNIPLCQVNCFLAYCLERGGDAKFKEQSSLHSCISHEKHVYAQYRR